MVQIASQQSSPARLAFCDRGTESGSVDGAWWPTSTDLRVALPDLVAVLGRLIGPVHRVVYDPAIWPHAPSRIIRGNTAVAVNPYALLARDTIYLMGTHSRDAVLYVVPPSSGHDVVGRLMHTISTTNQSMSVDMLRQLSGHFADAVQPPMP